MEENHGDILDIFAEGRKTPHWRDWVKCVSTHDGVEEAKRKRGLKGG